MSKPVFLLVLGKGHTEAYYQLSDEEKNRLSTQVSEVDRRAGGKWIILCKSRWADEEIFDWGVIEYPDMDAYQQKVDELEKLDWWRYFTAKTILGTKWEEVSGS